MERYTVPGMLNYMQREDPSAFAFAALSAWSKTECLPGSALATVLGTLRDACLVYAHESVRARLIALLQVQSICRDTRIESLGARSLTRASASGLRTGTAFEHYLPGEVRWVFWHPDTHFRPPWGGYYLSLGRSA